MAFLSAGKCTPVSSCMCITSWRLTDWLPGCSDMLSTTVSVHTWCGLAFGGHSCLQMLSHQDSTRRALAWSEKELQGLAKRSCAAEAYSLQPADHLKCRMHT